ncbi:MAG: glycosyltransferase family 4 protein [Betaproteobacteria bacterium]|nr:glycosyltransferase family 4 protein [Betaproteobacteria bacterium]
MPTPRAFCFLIPGDWSIPTGGFGYDRRLTQALVAAGWAVDVRRLDAAWPAPDTAALARARAVVADIADGSTVVADGLAFGVLHDVVAAHAERLRWVALVHHPLHLETGLAAAQRQRLRESESRALSFARSVVVTSPRTAQDVAAMGVPAARIHVVEPGTDAWPQGPAGRPAPLPAPARTDGPVRLLCVATVTPRKGHALLLQALAGLQRRPFPSWQLHCVGSLARDAATAARVQALARELALAGRVVWHGEVDAAALQAHYAAADLLVLASLHEGYGMVVAEALAAGLPVLASDAGALAQTLPAQAGWRVPPGDVPALQAALQRLIGDPALREQLAAGAREAGRRLPDWPTQAARFAAVLDALP